mmetsp:Transcript_44972/g.84040  ORF Transcript_44972/g.84040 Transcript_44972/m.84040 type:complete len:201 (-) Transcript_44972:133-735(-)
MVMKAAVRPASLSPVRPPPSPALVSGLQPTELGFPQDGRRSLPPPPLLPPPPPAPEVEAVEDDDSFMLSYEPSPCGVPGKHAAGVDAGADRLQHESQHSLRQRLLALRRQTASLRERCQGQDVMCREVQTLCGTLNQRLEDERCRLVGAQELHGRLLWTMAARRSHAEALSHGISDLCHRYREKGDENCAPAPAFAIETH